MQKYAILLLLTAASCAIENDLDYPIVTGSILEIEVSGQLSSSIINSTRTIHIELNYGTDPSNLVIEKLSLSEGASCEELQVGASIDLSDSLKVTVKTYQDYIWSIYATVNEPIDVDAWTDRATFSKDAEDFTEPGVFEWKQVDSETWTTEDEVSPVDGYFTCSIEGLEPDTKYVVRFSSSEVSTEYVYFSTESEAQIANMSFDEWHRESVGSSKYSWYPGPSIEEGRVWDSANKGVLTLQTTCPTTPEEEFVAISGEGKKAVRMEAMFPNLLGIGRFAAGNVITGEFVRATGSGGGLGAIMNWGTPFTSRPATLKGYYSYKPQTIDHDDLGKHADLIGQIDSMQIIIMLGDWAEPFQVNTAEGIFIDQENDSNIIGYGKFESSETTTDASGNLVYKEFEIPIEYRVTGRKPKYAIITVCTSKYGDDFTGGVGSLLYVDEFEFTY